MYEIMLSYPNDSSSQFQRERWRIKMRPFALKMLPAALISAGLILCAPAVAGADSALPSKPQAQSESSQSVQPQVDKQAAEALAQKRKELARRR